MIACISVNDAFVMSEWGKANNADGKVRMLADTNAEFTKVSLHCDCLQRNTVCYTSLPPLFTTSLLTYVSIWKFSPCLSFQLYQSERTTVSRRKVDRIVMLN